MLRQTRLVAAAEFKQKSRWSRVWPNMHYGAMYLPYSVGRQMPMRGVNWVTRDSNRLTAFEGRYGSVLADLDTKKNEEELNIPLTDVRWNDHRRLWWRCAFCGNPYRKNVSVRTKFHAGCNYCKGRYPSEVLREQRVSASLGEKYPALVAELAPTGKESNIASLSCTSKFRAQWTCRGCGQPYEASIRSRTGAVEEGQAALHPQVAEWSAFCPACRWQRNLETQGRRALTERQLLGLELSAPRPTAEAKRIPRRRKLVA